MRKIKIENEELLAILADKRVNSEKAKPLLDEMQSIKERYDEIEVEVNKLNSEQTRIDEKARPFVKDLLKGIKYGEIEMFERVSQDDNGDWNIVITDRIEELKTAIAEDGKKLEEDLDGIEKASE